MDTSRSLPNLAGNAGAHCSLPKVEMQQMPLPIKHNLDQHYETQLRELEEMGRESLIADACSPTVDRPRPCLSELRMNSRSRVQLFTLFGSALLSAGSINTAADCLGPAVARDEQGTGRLALLDITVATHPAPSCRGVPPASPAPQRLTGVQVSLRESPVDARYQWSRTADQSMERHAMTLQSGLRSGLSVRTQVAQAFSLRGGAGETQVALDTALDLNGIRSRLTMRRESVGEQRVTGADLNMDVFLLGEVVSARVEHGERWLEGHPRGSARLASSKLRFRVARDGMRLRATYSQSVDVNTGERSTYAAGAAVPVRYLGLQGQTAELAAELAVSPSGDAIQALRLTDKQRSLRGHRMTDFRFSQSETGRQQVKLGMSHSPFVNLTFESAIELSSDSHSDDTLVTLGATVQF